MHNVKIPYLIITELNHAILSRFLFYIIYLNSIKKNMGNLYRMNSLSFYYKKKTKVQVSVIITSNSLSY